MSQFDSIQREEIFSELHGRKVEAKFLLVHWHDSGSLGAKFMLAKLQ
jgi:hypothetical protein